MEKSELYTEKIFATFGKFKKFMMNRHHCATELYDITPSEQMLLFRMNKWHKEKIIVTDIVNILELAPSTVSLTLNSLESKGYIKRTVNKDNRREIYVDLTDKGKKILDKVKIKNRMMVKDLFDYLGEEDSEKLIDLLEKMISFLEREENNNKEC